MMKSLQLFIDTWVDYRKIVDMQDNIEKQKVAVDKLETATDKQSVSLCQSA